MKATQYRWIAYRRRLWDELCDQVQVCLCTHCGLRYSGINAERCCLFHSPQTLNSLASWSCLSRGSCHPFPLLLSHLDLPGCICLLLLTWKPDVVHQSHHSHTLDDCVCGVKLPPFQASVGWPLKCVMVVVPLAHGDDCNPPAVLRQVIGFIWLVSPHMGPRVDCERDVKDCYNLHKHKTISVSYIQASSIGSIQHTDLCRWPGNWKIIAIGKSA